MKKTNQADGFFYEDRDRITRHAANRILSIICPFINPTSVVDVGCGVGTWLSVSQEMGATKVLGFDEDYVDRDLLQIHNDDFISCDLNNKIPITQQFDLAISLEVAEHLHKNRAESFIAELTSASPYVLFSAAIPWQGGNGHKNEQWQSYWSDLFGRFGYSKVDCIRPLIWNDEDIPIWYKQNTLLYVNQSHFTHVEDLATRYKDTHTDVVHPGLYLLKAKRPLSVKLAFKLFRASLKHALFGR